MWKIHQASGLVEIKEILLYSKDDLSLTKFWKSVNPTESFNKWTNRMFLFSKDIYKLKRDMKSIQVNTNVDSVNNPQIPKDFWFGM